VQSFVKTVLVSLAASIALAGMSLAADLPVPPKMPPVKAAPAPQNDFEKLGADCVEATDGCRRFTRASDGKYDAANNIGIACQPKPLSCTKRK
jgi:hypothetical protein